MKNLLCSTFILIILINSVSPDFILGEPPYELKNSYGPGEDVAGWINISFANQNSNTIISDNFGNTIMLNELLGLNEDSYEYNCTTKNCDVGYVLENQTKTKSFVLEKNNIKILGFKFDRNVESIDSIKFEFESDADKFCERQIEIDLLNDGSIEYGSNESSGFYCDFSKSYGCFDEEMTLDEYSLATSPQKHCQRISLLQAPGYRLGVEIDPMSSTEEITVSLYDLYGSPVEGGSCVISDFDERREYSCDINHNIYEDSEYYVCVYSEEESSAKIYGYIDEETGCGIYDSDISRGEEIASFKIFAEPMRYKSLADKTFIVGNELQTGEEFAGIVLDYIIETYGDTDCTDSDCIVPFKLISGMSQNIEVKNLEVIYTEEGLGTTIESNLYDLVESPDKISSDYGMIYLDNAEFTLPLEKEDIAYKLNLNGNELFSEEIYTEDVPLIRFLRPIETASAYPTEFELFVDSSEGVESYTWDFGDNTTTETTGTNKITHVYQLIGDYYLTLNVKDNLGRETVRTFKISVKSPKNLINSTLIEYNERLKNINEQIKSFDEFSKKRIEEFLDMGELEDILRNLERKYLSSDLEEEYNEIIAELVLLNLPSSIFISEKADNIQFYPKEEVIDIEIIKGVTKSDPEEEGLDEEYKKAIVTWHYANIDSNINLRKFSVKYGDNEIQTLSIMELQLKEKERLSRNPYLIIKNMQELKFEKNYLEDTYEDYYSIDMRDSSLNVTFSTTEEFELQNLPLFITPELSRIDLSLIGQVSEVEENFKWVLFILIIVFLLIASLTVYIFLQEWYKKKYEVYLFKESNNLYNLIFYVDNSTKKGMSEIEIKRKLKEAGWKNEQIEYALNKYYGKRTGMFEVPYWNVLSKLRMKIRLKKMKAQKQNIPPRGVPPVQLKKLPNNGFRYR